MHLIAHEPIPEEFQRQVRDVEIAPWWGPRLRGSGETQLGADLYEVNLDGEVVWEWHAGEWRLQNRTTASHKVRKTPLYPSEMRAREKAKRLRRLRRAKRPKRTRYSTETYWKALNYAFKKAAAGGKVGLLKNRYETPSLYYLVHVLELFFKKL